MATRKEPDAIVEPVDPTSPMDRARTVARLYRTLGLELLELEEVQTGECAKDTDPVIVAGQFVFIEDGEATIAGRKVSSYRQRRRKLHAGMKAYEKKHAGVWTFVEEEIKKLKDAPQG